MFSHRPAGLLSKSVSRLWNSCLRTSISRKEGCREEYRGLTVGDRSWNSLSQAERIAPHKVSSLSEWVIQSVEEVWSRGRQQVLDVLLQSVNVVAFRGFGHEAVVVDRVDILFLGHGIAKAAAGRVLEGDAGGLVAEDALNVLAVVQLVVEALRHLYFAGVITILNHNQVVLLEERSPLLQEVQVPDRGNHNVQFVRERRAFGI